MKRGIILLVLLALLISPTIFAAGDNTTIPSPEQIKEGLSALGGGLEDKTENIIEREIQIPNQLQIPVRIIFGLKDKYVITIERFVVLCAIWMMFFFLIQGILKLTPFLNKGLQNIIGPIIITVIIAITGIINSIVIFFFSLGDTFEWLEALGPFQIFVALAIVALILFITHHILNIVEKKLIITKAEISGENIGTMVTIAKTNKKSIDKLSK